MSLFLSAVERRKFTAVQQSMLSPLVHGDFRSWQIDVNRGLRDLVGADHTITFRWDEDVFDLFSDDTEMEWMLPLKDHFRGYDGAGNATFESEAGSNPFIPFIEQLHRARRLSGSSAVCDLEYAEANEMKRTEYFHATHVPAGVCFMLGLGTALPVGEVTTCVGFERPDASGYQEGSLHMLELLVPSYAAGVRVWRQAGGYRKTLESSGIALMVVGRDEKVLFESRALGRLLADELESGAVLKAIRSQAARMIPERRVRSAATKALTTNVSTCSTQRRGYEIMGSLLRESVFEEEAVLMIVQPRTSALPTPPEMQERFGLTPREAEVAELIARGLDNRTIAERLFISPHTVRRHTERILAKLDIDSRAAVAISLIQPD